MPFSAPMDHYNLFKLDRADYTRWQELEPGYEFVTEIDRSAERALLQSEFPHWQIPFNRQMPGLSELGVIAVARDGELVGVSYACVENELGLEGYGQIHYAAVAPEHRGHKLLAAMVTEMFRRFPDFKGGIFYVDRQGHESMYERWGGYLRGRKAKAAPALGRIRGRLGAARRRLTGSGPG